MGTHFKNEDRFKKFILNAEQLLREIQHKKIQIQTKEIRELYEDLMELTLARHKALIGARKIHCFDKKIDEILDRILKTETPFSNSNKDHHGNIEDLEQMQIDLRQNVNDIIKEGNILVSEYPDAVDHIVAKRRELLRSVERLDDMVKDRDRQLEQNEQLLDYYTNFREIMGWANEFLAR